MRIAAAFAAIAASGALSLILIGDPGVDAAPGSPLITVALDEWTIESAGPTIIAGGVTILAENRGSLDHELLVLRTRRAAPDLRQGLAAPVPGRGERFVLGSPHTHQAGVIANHLEPGEEAEHELDLRPGRYVLYCGLPGHYRRGQYAGLIVVS